MWYQWFTPAPRIIIERPWVLCAVSANSRAICSICWRGTPVICSAYRTQDFQQTLYDNKVSEWMEQGYSREEAREKAGHQVAVPSTSEHQLGLAVDIVDVNYQLLDTNQENTAVQKWLLENSWRYGFILRYPTDQTDVTGIVYEPWHYRYVGKEYAQDIYKKGLCLEQYLEQWGK